MLRLLISFLFISLISSCKNEVTFAQVTASDPAVVIRGAVYDGLPLYVYVVKAVPELSGVIDYRLRGAKVGLYKDDLLLEQLVEVTEDDGVVSVAGTSQTWYKTTSPIFLEPGSVYFLSVEATGIPTARSVPIKFDPVIQIDSISNTDKIINLDGVTFAESINLETFITVLREAEGSLRISLGYAGDNRIPDTINRRVISRNFDFYGGPEPTILLDPFPGRSIVDVNYSAEISSYEPCRCFFVMEYTFFPKDYIDFVQPLFIGNRFEDFNGINSRIGPIPTNIENGYGFFTLAERYRFWIPLPE